MAASDHKEDAGKGINAAHDPKDDIGTRCAKGGLQAAKTTSGGKPVIREWEYGVGSVIVFTTIDSCLGAIQIAGKDSVRGAHFSMFASGEQYDEVKFGEAMAKAGFDAKSTIYYFGGGVSDWEQGLGHSIWWKVRTKLPFADEAQKRWIFEVKAGQLTSATL
jgi:hypothetical protein